MAISHPIKRESKAVYYITTKNKISSRSLNDNGRRFHSTVSGAAILLERSKYRKHNSLNPKHNKENWNNRTLQLHKQSFNHVCSSSNPRLTLNTFLGTQAIFHFYFNNDPNICTWHAVLSHWLNITSCQQVSSVKCNLTRPCRLLFCLRFPHLPIILVRTLQWRCRPFSRWGSGSVAIKIVMGGA